METKNLYEQKTTIAAIATPPGCGGIGIIRISGPKALAIAKNFVHAPLVPRYTYYTYLNDARGNPIDQGLIIYFAAPFSFNGEDVIEIQAHGGPLVMDLLLKRVLELGAKLAEPGEFSKRAFLNGKMDLVQAEATIDLINALSQDAARSAVHSLQGEFSKLINQLKEQLVSIRVQIEASIDFPDEELDLDSIKELATAIQHILDEVDKIVEATKQGILLREGISIVIVGKPNVGKSSLLNLFTGEETAIVTPIAGTTRDVLKAAILIDGLPVKILDTAGLQETSDIVEQEGIRRANLALQQADHILLVSDATEKTDNTKQLLKWLQQFLPNNSYSAEKVTLIHNKIDLQNKQPKKQQQENIHSIFLSAKTGEGFNLLRQHLKNIFGFGQSSEGIFTARRRHLEALKQTQLCLQQTKEQLQTNTKQLELVAENLRLAQNELSKITGEFSSEDLLTKIFSEFCLGK